MSYVLIIIFGIATGQPSMSITTQEFGSLPACLDAADKVTGQAKFIGNLLRGDGPGKTAVLSFCVERE